METISSEKFIEVITKYKESLCIVCAGNGALKSEYYAIYLATSEESAKNFFDSIVNELPEHMRTFSTVKLTNFDDIYSFGSFFNQPSFKFICLVDYGVIEKDNFIKKNPENVEYIYERVKNLNDNDFIYSVYKKDNNAFHPTEDFKQHFFSNKIEVDQFIKQYNNEELGLFASPFEFDVMINGSINETLNCCFDGRDCSGWDMGQALYKHYRENELTDEDVKQIVENNKLRVLIATDGSNYVMSQRNNAVFFTSNEKAQKFLDRNKNNQTHEFSFYEIESLDAYEKLIANSQVVYIDAEKHCITRNFLVGLGIRKKQKNWESMEEVKQKAKSLWEKEMLYIILSFNNANPDDNTSIPYVPDIDPLRLCIFEDLEAAKEFTDKIFNQKINNNHLIGVIYKSKPLWSLETTLTIANMLNIKYVEFNPEEYEAIYFPIKEFFEFNGKELQTTLSTLVPAGAENQNVQVRFNIFSFDWNADMFYKKDWKPADEIQAKILNEYKKIYLPAGYSKHSYQLLYHVIEHFVRYAKSKQDIKFFKSNVLLDFINSKTEKDFTEMVLSYKLMDHEMVNKNFDKTVEDMKEIVKKIDVLSIKNLLKGLRDLLFNE